MPRYIIFGIVFIVPLLIFFSISCDKDSVTEPKTETINLTKISGENQQGVQGDTLSTALMILVADKDGKAVSDKQVDFTIIEGKGTLSVENTNTDENGRASTILTLGDQQGKVTVEAKISGTNISTTFTAIVGIHKPFSIEIINGNGQSGCPGETLPEPLQVVVKDNRGRPYKGSVVTFNIDEGEGTLSVFSDTTSVSGYAQTMFSLGEHIGKSIINASIQEADSINTVKFTVTVVPPKILIYSGNNQYGDLGEVLSKSFQVNVVNNSNEPITGVVINFEITKGSGLLSATADTSNTYGIAESTLTLSDKKGEVRVLASIDKFDTISYVTFSATALPPIVEIVSGNYQQGFSGEQLTEPLQIVVKNNKGIPLNGILVTFKIIEGKGILSDSEVTTSGNGIAETRLTIGEDFSDIRVSAEVQEMILPLYFYIEVFSSSRIAYEFKNDIYVMNTDGSNKINLTKSAYEDKSPSWSPDGKRIVFISNPDEYPYDIYVMNSDGSNIINITNISTNDVAYSPSWSPIGDKIAYNFKGDIFVMDYDGSNQIKLTNTEEIYELNPVWTHDGLHILFNLYSNTIPSKKISDIYVMDAQGTNIINLTNTPDIHEFSPSCSPDGNKIAYVSTPAGKNEHVIYTMDFDGSNQIKLTDAIAVIEKSPSWSPDGSQIVFSTKYGMYSDIRITNYDGSNMVNITNNPANINISSPSWSPNIKR